MNINDLDWRTMMNTWSEADIRYLRSICDEKLNRIGAGTIKRRTIIRGQG